MGGEFCGQFYCEIKDMPSYAYSARETATGREINSSVEAVTEQAAIAAYLDEETAKLDALVGKVEGAVERLQEYRTALIITAAVTGKIDVRAVKR